METARGLDDAVRHSQEPSVGEPGFVVGTDERRMHVRAYNYWVSLLKGRAYPSIEDLNPENISDFGANSVLLDFTGGIDDPAIRFLGRALREECGVASDITHISAVPARSLLSRLTDHYLQIIANRAPIGFEAEFVGTRGHTTLYRGILMPFSSDEDTIDFIYGVINWKEMVDAETQASLAAELSAAVRDTPRPAAPLAPAPVWADGPSAAYAPRPSEPVAGLGDQLALARESAAAVQAADSRGRAALYRALGRAHDFALAADGDPSGYEALLADAGITAQARAPMTPVVKLIFGADYDKTRLTEFAAVLSHARRHAVEAGGLGDYLERQSGGIKAVVAAERAARRPEPTPAPEFALAAQPALAHLSLDTDAAPGDVVLLVARACPSGVEIVGQIADAALAQRALKVLAKG